MSLQIQSLELRNFRNYSHGVLKDLGNINIFVGENATGKTNLIEAIQLLTALTSFRHSTFDMLVRTGSLAAKASLKAADEYRQLEIDLLLEGKTRKYRLNGKARRPLDIKGVIPSITFTPDDLNLIKGPQSGRRAALDTLGTQIHKSYYLVRRDYEKVIKHKNRLLKDEADPAMVDAINEMVITVGSQLACYRLALFNRLRPYLLAKYQEIAEGKDRLGLSYEFSWEDKNTSASEAASSEEPRTLTRQEARENLAWALREHAPEEYRRQRALVGPHGDKILFTLDGKDASLYGSQGQQRSIVLAWKLAEATVIEEILDHKPVLLLDDVMSELDAHRRHALVTAMEGTSQTFITTANIDYFDSSMLARSNVVELPLEA